VSYVLVFLAGAAFSGHCVAMCGAFPLALRTGARTHSAAAGLQLLYHAGKISTYVFLGVLAASAGLRLEPWRRPLTVAAGLMLLAVGTASLAPPQTWPRITRWVQGSPLCWVLSGLVGDARPLSAFSLGLFNGFIPCGLVYAMLAYAATLGTARAAALTLLCFGLGTVPALGLVGMLAQQARRRLRLHTLAPRWVRASGLLTVLLGLLTMARAFGSTHAHLPAWIASALS